MIAPVGTTGFDCLTVEPILILANISGFRVEPAFDTTQRTRTVRVAESTVGLMNEIRAGNDRLGADATLISTGEPMRMFGRKLSYTSAITHSVERSEIR